VGWGAPHPTRLTPDEQYTHISLWCLLGSPLLIGCDLERLDPFTISLLTNDEVLAVDQDPLCAHANQVSRSGDLRVYAKPLEDGSWAVGLINLGASAETVTAIWSDIGVSGPRRVRDLWRQMDLGVFEGGFGRTVPSHGVVLVRVFPAGPAS
jgi:alpha-galactosidase